MRFTLIKDLKNESSMRWILNLLLLFSSLYIAADIFVKYISFGVSISSVKATLFGSEEEFLDPITQGVFLEIIHTEIFFIMMLLLTLSTLFIRLFHPSKVALIVLNIAMISALLSLISLGASFYISALFVPLYILCFYLWHLSALYMSLGSLWRLNA